MNIALSKTWANELFPGVALCATVAMAAAFLAAHYGAPVMLFALLLGMAFNFVDPAGKFQPGIAFASKVLLRTGVALLGVRITFTNIADLGVEPIFIVAAGLGLTLLTGVVLARAMGYSTSFGLLTGGAVGICGASAALAISSVLPKGQGGITERDTVFTVVAVTTLSTVAMVLYPILTGLLGFDDWQAGVFIGATIHDVAQVVGAGFSVSEAAGETSTIVKLMRVAMLMPVIAGMTLFIPEARGSVQDAPVRFPAFLLGFLGLMAANSFGAIPAPVASAAADTSRWLLVAAIAGLGTKTSLAQIMEIGPRAAGIVLFQTAALAAFAAVILAFGG